MKKLNFLLGITLSGLFLFNSNLFASTKDVYYTTTINGKEYELIYPSRDGTKKKYVLKNLEKAIAESNRITEAYLKTNSPAWKDLNTEEFKANNKTFRDVWYQIVVERHYNKDVLDAYEKFKSMQLKNHEKMYDHFFKLSSNEPFKEKVRAGRDDDQVIFKGHLNVIKHLRTYL